MNSLGVFHHSLSASLASFADMVSKSKGPPMLRPGAKTVWPLIRHAHLKAGYVCTQRYGLINTDAPHCRFTICFVHSSKNTTTGVRLCTRTGLHRNRVGVTMPLEIALSPQARVARFPPAPTQNWAYQAGTRGFIDVPFRGFLGPP